tara:strand:+ start:449 stop:859 length:411 start_codon:yes stop_codon:yes gene_type:complete
MAILKGQWGGLANTNYGETFLQWADTTHLEDLTQVFPEDIHCDWTLWVNTASNDWANALSNIVLNVHVSYDGGTTYHIMKTETILSGNIKGKPYRFKYRFNSDGVVPKFKIGLDPSAALNSSGTGKEKIYLRLMKH